jgi:nucleotide-binding universal stress UspA family protein
MHHNLYRRILVALDIMEPAVFETALSIASATGADLLLLHVLSDRDAQSPMSPVTTDGWYDLTPWGQEAWKTYQQQWKAYVEKSLTMLRDCTERAETLVTADFLQMTDTPSKGICKAAKTWQADLIVMGSHQRKGIHELVLGSVSNEVMHHAPCSVMIVSLEENSLKNTQPEGELNAAFEYYQSV